jgi:hypothetical protein
VHTLTDEETQVVEQEAPVTDQTTESEDQQTERQEEQKEQAPVRKDAEYNWSEARRKMQELERRTREQQEVIDRLSQGQQKSDDDEIANLSNDDILTVAQARKMQAAREKQAQIEFMKLKNETLQLRYPDMEQVLSQENIANFEQQEPELAETLVALSGDPLKMKVAAYKLIKKTIKQDAPPSVEKKKAEANSKKPVSVQSVTKSSPIGNAHLFENGLTPELRKQMWAEMQQAIKSG